MNKKIILVLIIFFIAIIFLIIKFGGSSKDNNFKTLELAYKTNGEVDKEEKNTVKVDNEKNISLVAEK